ncbi:MAG: hypothetical protein ACLFSU_02935 [Acholeplasmataceae bacterium]
MADKYNRVEPKVPPLTIAILVSLVVIIVAIIVFTRPSDAEQIHAEYTVTARTDLTEEHPFKSVEYEDGFLGMREGLKSMIEDEEYLLVYFGHAECESCLAHVAPYESYFFDEGVDEYFDHIYYYNPLDESSTFETIQTDHEGIRGSVPQLVLFVDGEVEVAHEPPETSEDQEPSERQINRRVMEFYLDVLEVVENS